LLQLLLLQLLLRSLLQVVPKNSTEFLWHAAAGASATSRARPNQEERDGQHQRSQPSAC
jgi:hypothetical protein